MKKFLNVRLLPIVTIAASIAAFCLSATFYTKATGTGELLRTSHPAGIALLILSGVVMLALFLASRKIPKELPLEALLPSSPIRAIGCFIGTVGIAYSCIVNASSIEVLSILSLVMGVAAGVCMLFVATQRLMKMPANYVFYGIVTVFFMCLGLLRCRQWSTETQILQFVFSLLAYVFLLLTSYCYTSVCLTGKSARNLILFSHLSVFFCCAAFFAHKDPFYLTCALWLLLDCCFFRTEKPEETEPETEPAEEE